MMKLFKTKYYRAVLLSFFIFLLCSCYANAEQLEIESTDLTTGEITRETVGEDSIGCISQTLLPNEEDISPYSIIGEDDRIIVENTKKYPYRCIGKLEIRYPNSSTYTVGTGFLVGDSIVLTAAHCVYSTKEIESITFIPAKNGSTNPYGKFKATKKHVFTKYKDAVASGDIATQMKYDFALIELNSPIGSSIGYMNLGGYGTPYNANWLNGRNVIIAGYPGNKGSKLYRDKAPILSFSDDKYRMYYAIDTEGGQSGSPIIKYVDGAYYAVGIHTNGGSTQNSGRYVSKGIYNLVNKYK